MGTLAIPDRIIARFRTVGLERLARVEAGWMSLTHGHAGASEESTLFRDLHTLKGDARVVGFGDVALLCQRLEDLVFAARERRYQVREEVDILVTMSIQFVGMLLRKKGPAGGIDLAGFVKQIEELLRDFPKGSERPRDSIPPSMHGSATTSLIPISSRDALGGVATTLYLEHLRAKGASSLRLRDAWTVLVREIAQLEASPIGPMLARHAAAASDLARDLGKSVHVAIDAGDIRARMEVIETLNGAILHLLRNAVDHGIEAPEARAKAGKPEVGTIDIRAREEGERIEIVVRDDGGGIDLDRVRARAVAKRLLDVDRAASTPEHELVQLIFRAGFSTSETISEISGRGIGLDAVRASIEALGGSIHVESERGRGAVLTIRVPQASGSLDVLSFVPLRSALRFAVPATWSRARADARVHAHRIDLLAMFELPIDVAADLDLAPALPLLLEGQSTPIRFDVRADPVIGRAIRFCPTGPQTAIEIVDLEGEEAVLLRPHAVLARATS